MKKTSKIIVIMMFLSAIISAQEIITENNRTVFKIMPYYQTWSGINNADFRQYSSRVSLNYFLDRDTRISLQSGYASSDVSKSKISGFSDAQLALNHKLRKLNIALDLGINLPTGDEKIDPANFISTVLLSQDLFNIKMPVLGQGTNIFAGLTWAKDITDMVVIGLGASYQIKGEYYPIADGSILYKPSNDLLITGGIDLRLNTSATISTDVIGIFYGQDKVNGQDAFSAGTKIIVSSMFKQNYGRNNLTVYLRYRNSGVEEVFAPTEIYSSDKISPNSFMALINFRHYISKYISLTYLLEGRIYEKTIAPFSGYNIYGIGIGSNMSLSSNFSFPLTAKYYLGNSQDSSSIRGYELGFGIDVTF